MLMLEHLLLLGGLSIGVMFLAGLTGHLPPTVLETRPRQLPKEILDALDVGPWLLPESRRLRYGDEPQPPLRESPATAMTTLREEDPHLDHGVEISLRLTRELIEHARERTRAARNSLHDAEDAKRQTRAALARSRNLLKRTGAPHRGAGLRSAASGNFRDRNMMASRTRVPRVAEPPSMTGASAAQPAI
jgi:hypothetical protein